MKTSRFVATIDQAIAREELLEPFRPSDVEVACPGFAHSTYSCFLPKHARNNPDGNKEYFERIEPDLYRRL